MKKKINKKGISYGFISGLVILSMVAYMTFQPSLEIDDGEWHVVLRMDAARAAEPDAGSSGWLATFLLNYSATPAKMANGTWYESAGNVTGYIQTDGGSAEVPSEAGHYIVCRVKFNKDQCWDGDDSQFVHTRTKCHMTVSGSMGGDDFTDQPGTHSLHTRSSDANSTSGTNLYINFYWDDGSNGYAVADDGTLNWNVTVYAKY